MQFENLVNYDKSKTKISETNWNNGFENLVNYDKSKTAEKLEEEFTIV